MPDHNRQDADFNDVPPPRVRWVDAHYPEEFPMLEREGHAVEALLQEIWMQLPRLHRRMVGGIVECVHVFRMGDARWAGAVNPCRRTEGFAGVNIACLEDPGESNLRLLVVEELASACTWGMAAWLAGTKRGRLGLPAERQGTPATAWWEAIQPGSSAERIEVADCLARLAMALLLIWGYGEQWAEGAPLDTVFDPSPDACTPSFEAEIGKIYRVLERRIKEVPLT
jgi:hypothetical protein